MQALLSLSGVIDAISKKLGQISDYLVLFCALISAGNAIVRYFFSYSSNGWLEIQWYMFAGIVLLGASYTLKMNEHVRVDLVYGSVKYRTRDWIDLLGGIFFLVPFCVLMIHLSWPWFLEAWSGDELSQNAGGLPRWP